MTTFYEKLGFHDGGVITLVGAGGKTTLMFRLAHELSQTDGPVLTTTTTKIYLPKPEESETVIILDPLQDMAPRCRDVLKHTHHVTAAAGYQKSQNKLTGFSSEDVQNLWETGLFKWILVEADGAAHRSLKAPASYEPVIPACTRWLVTLVGMDAIGKPLDEQWVFRSQLYSRITGLLPGDTVTEDSVVKAILHDQGLMKGCPAGANRYVFFNKADDDLSRHSGRRAAALLCSAAKKKLDAVFIGSAQGDAQQTEYMGIQ
ncbi:MAG TPA: selenium cofactor biosynthesis protein YqeC [Deltaproteobacteria bacterium]|nr:selenium cofactor biosynthesis protein YqeC [Deltaproteobacteria bacterium]